MRSRGEGRDEEGEEVMHASTRRTMGAAALLTLPAYSRAGSKFLMQGLEPAYEAADLGSPAGCAAAAAFWSGGSLAPKDLPVVPPPNNLTGHGVASALMLAGVVTEPDKFKVKYTSFLERGLAIARGKLKYK